MEIAVPGDAAQVAAMAKKLGEGLECPVIGKVGHNIFYNRPYFL